MEGWLPLHVLSLPRCVLRAAALPPPGAMAMTLTELKLHRSLLLGVVMAPQESGSWLKNMIINIQVIMTEQSSSELIAF